MQNAKSQFAGKKLFYSKDFVMQCGQHLTLEYDKVEPDSEWCVTLNQQKVILALLNNNYMHFYQHYILNLIYIYYMYAYTYVYML